MYLFLGVKEVWMCSAVSAAVCTALQIIGSSAHHRALAEWRLLEAASA